MEHYYFFFVVIYFKLIYIRFLMLDIRITQLDLIIKCLQIRRNELASFPEKTLLGISIVINNAFFNLNHSELTHSMTLERDRLRIGNP
jgi:hypothetical protein